MKYFDSHLHAKGVESGGFIVGLEGEDLPADVFRNPDAEALSRMNDAYVFFRYVRRSDVERKVINGDSFLKFHPRREGYGVEAVGDIVQSVRPRVVMIDTLNEPFWTPYDYWRLSRQFPDVKFVLAHAGGYAIADFIKICHIQRNVWIDFSLTHSHFGGISKNPLPGVDDYIRYAFSIEGNRRILVGSDYPYDSQEPVIDYYMRNGLLDLANENFVEFVDGVR